MSRENYYVKEVYEYALIVLAILFLMAGMRY
jgi:hypothetical protein